jgi:hypothetical protein
MNFNWEIKKANMDETFGHMKPEEIRLMQETFAQQQQA